MSDSPEPATSAAADAAAPATPPTPDAATAKPVKPPRLFRWWGIILVVLVAGVLAIAMPFIVEPWVLGKIRNGLASQGWELTPASTLQFQLYGGKLSGDHLEVRMIKPSTDGTQAQVATCSTLSVDMAIGATLASRDLVIAELIAEGVTGNFRRGPDGRIPTAPEEESQGGTSTDWSKVDWLGWYQKGMERYKKWSDDRQAQQQTESKPADHKPTDDQPSTVQRPPPQQDIDWPQAEKYQPKPQQGRRVPRILVQTLKISGSAVKLPDESPFEIQNFTINGTDVADRQNVGEIMKLDGKLATKGAGEATLDLLRKADGTGTLALRAPAVPVAALSDRSLAGDRFAPYGATGTADVSLNQAWTDWDLDGALVAKLSDLAMSPTGGDARARQVAQVVNALKGKPIAWPVRFGGKLYAPTITDSGVDDVLKGGVLDAAKEVAKDKATEEASKLIDKQADKNPQIKKATDSLKGLLGK